MEKGKYKTEQKTQILDYITNNNNTFTVDNIYKHFEKKRNPIGLSTIYRFLNELEKQEKVQIEINNSTKHYKYISDECKIHQHLKCRKCGKIIHLDCTDFYKFKKHIEKEHGFTIDMCSYIYGLCSDCK